MLNRWVNFQYLLNGLPCDIELSPSQPAVYMIPFHKGIGVEFPNDFSVDIPQWVQQLCPHPFFEHFQDESVF